MTSVWMVAVAFLLMAPWGSRVVAWLLQKGIGKRIRAEEPSAHQGKSGTATMGGLYILSGVAVLSMGLAVAGHAEVLVPLAVMLAFGLLGVYDDLQGLHDQSGVGWLARTKFSWQWILALLVALALYVLRQGQILRLPGSTHVVELGLLSVPFAALWLVWSANAVNLADGMDGLAGGIAAIAFGAFALLAAQADLNGLALFCFACVGALLAFLWQNVHPARLFMGDVGSQALGAGLAIAAILSGHWLLLPLIGIVPLAEALSVMLQVGYFKYTRRKFGEGRRIFRMAPLHYHYELAGWSEVQVTLRFWIVSIAAAALAVAMGAG
jgi:phospho-N-acetylmuramoyl-pentapeptide-transferase